MNALFSDQLNLFLRFLLYGVIIGVIFDIFRIIRKCYSISDFHTYIEDILFGIITSTFLILVLYVYNTGRIRLYMFIALLIGLVSYFLVISKYFIKVHVFIISLIRRMIKVIIKILLWPIKKCIIFFRGILDKPFMILIINIKKLINIKKFQKRQKKLHKKKDFIS